MRLGLSQLSHNQLDLTLVQLLSPTLLLPSRSLSRVVCMWPHLTPPPMCLPVACMSDQPTYWMPAFCVQQRTTTHVLSVV